MRSITRGLLLLSTIGLASCGEVVAPSAERAQELRAPAGQLGASTNVEGFYWLPPMVPDPGPFTGVFDGGRSLVVRVVCAGASGPGCPVTAQFDAATPGAGQLRVDPEEEAYIANWHTPEALELGGGRYRLEVLEGGVVIGQAPLWVVARRQDLRSMTAGHVGLVRGQPFLIKFRVEEDGAPPPPPPPPPPLPPSCVDCLEVVPGALLLPGLGAQVQLQAFLVDQAGERTPVTPVWSSSQTEHVVVTTSGIAIAASDAGSSQVTATAGGRTSAPVLAVVARPAVGVLLLSDADIVATMDPVDVTAPFGPGWQYRVRLRGITPAVGQGMVGVGQLGVAGRVVSVADAGGGLVDVILEIVPVEQLFMTFAVQAELALGDGLDVADDASASGVAAGGAPRFAAPAIQAVEANKLEFSLGPFKCEVTGQLNAGSPFGLENYSFDVSSDLNVAVDYRLAGLKSIIVTGTITPQLAANPVSAVAMKASAECRKLLKIIPVPILGVLSVFIGARVALGVGFGAELDVPVADVGADLFAKGHATVSFGYDRSRPYGAFADASGSVEGYLKPVLPLEGWDQLGRISAGLAGFGWAEFRVGGPIEATQATLVQAKVGLKQSAELASEQYQAEDPLFANSLELTGFVEAGTGPSLSAFGGFLGTDLLEFKSEYPFLQTKSPTGTLVIAPPFAVPGDGARLGEMVSFTTTMVQPTYMGFEAVDQVEIRWWEVDAEGKRVLANGRPGCTTIPRTLPGQVAYTCEADFLESHLGPQTFMSFYRPSLFGVPLPIRFEIAPDSRATVEVMQMGEVTRMQQNPATGENFSVYVSLMDGIPDPSGGPVTEEGDWTWSSLSKVDEGVLSGYHCRREISGHGEGTGPIRIEPVTGTTGETRYQITFTRTGEITQVRTCRSLDPDNQDRTEITRFPAPSTATLVASGRGIRDADGLLVAINYGQSLTLANGTWWAKGGLRIKD